jgi:tRNA splicing ligase
MKYIISKNLNTIQKDDTFDVDAAIDRQVDSLVNAVDEPGRILNSYARQLVYFRPGESLEDSYRIAMKMAIDAHPETFRRHLALEVMAQTGERRSD